MSINVADLIYTGYRIAGMVTAALRGPSSSEVADGIAALNSMLDSWKAERLMVYAIVRSVQTIVANRQTYTIGTFPTPDFSIERPERIDRAGFIFTNASPDFEQPLRILTEQEWAALSPKGTTGTVSTMLYYEPSIPNGTIKMFPIPTRAGQIALYLWKTLDTFADATAQIDLLPPAYQKAIEYNLAYELAMRNPARARMSPVAILEAARSKAKVKAINIPVLKQRCEAACRGIGVNGGYNILSNTFFGA